MFGTSVSCFIASVGLQHQEMMMDCLCKQQQKMKRDSTPIKQRKAKQSNNRKRSEKTASNPQPSFHTPHPKPLCQNRQEPPLNNEQAKPALFKEKCLPHRLQRRSATSSPSTEDCCGCTRRSFHSRCASLETCSSSSCSRPPSVVGRSSRRR